MPGAGTGGSSVRRRHCQHPPTVISVSPHQHRVRKPRTRGEPSPGSLSRPAATPCPFRSGLLGIWDSLTPARSGPDTPTAGQKTPIFQSKSLQIPYNRLILNQNLLTWPSAEPSARTDVAPVAESEASVTMTLCRYLCAPPAPRKMEAAPPKRRPPTEKRAEMMGGRPTKRMGPGAGVHLTLKAPPTKVKEGVCEGQRGGWVGLGWAVGGGGWRRALRPSPPRRVPAHSR